VQLRAWKNNIPIDLVIKISTCKNEDFYDLIPVFYDLIPVLKE
jgi:hypothetical protein